MRKGAITLELLVVLFSGFLSILNPYIFPAVGAIAVNFIVERSRKAKLKDKYKPRSVWEFITMVMFGVFIAVLIVGVGAGFHIIPDEASKFVGGIVGVLSPHIITFLESPDNFKSLFSRVLERIK